MIRLMIVLLATLALAGCAPSYRGYHGSYAPSYAGDSGYTQSYGQATGVGYGDYYYGTAPTSSYHYPTWVDNPYYYSLFWPMQRTFHDPYWNPGFYYGVTYFPRNYFSLSFYGGGSRHGYYSRPWGASYAFSYSPYRHAWVDNYYDWYAYQRYSPRGISRYYAPRYGNARHEAERLAYRSNQATRYAQHQYGLPRTDPRNYYGATYGNRGIGQRGPQYTGARGTADYRGQTAARVDPGVRGFDRDIGQTRGGSRNPDPRMADQGSRLGTGRDGRIDPGVRGFDRGVADRGVDDRGVRVDPSVRGFDRGVADRGVDDRGVRVDPSVRGFDRGVADRGVDDRGVRADPNVRGFDRGVADSQVRQQGPQQGREYSRGVQERIARDRGNQERGREFAPYSADVRAPERGQVPADRATGYRAMESQRAAGISGRDRGIAYPQRGAAAPEYRTPPVDRGRTAQTGYQQSVAEPSWRQGASSPQRQPSVPSGQRYEAVRQAPQYSAPQPAQVQRQQPARGQPEPTYSAPAAPARAARVDEPAPAREAPPTRGRGDRSGDSRREQRR